jgi:hypothetical protein
MEAKYRSGKSSEADEDQAAPADQLAREWDNLRALASPTDHPFLVYLTQDFGFPRDEIVTSVSEYCRKRPGNADASRSILWLSWRALSSLAVEGPVLRDLQSLTARLNLTCFNGVGRLRTPAMEWSFCRGGWTWNLPRAASLRWRFSE